MFQMCLLGRRKARGRKSALPAVRVDKLEKKPGSVLPHWGVGRRHGLFDLALRLSGYRQLGREQTQRGQFFVRERPFVLAVLPAIVALLFAYGARLVGLVGGRWTPGWNYSDRPSAL